MVDTEDKNIHSIVIRDEYKSIETKINMDKPQIIILDNFQNSNELDVVALDKNDKEIYYYGYPKNINVTKVEDYKWHYVEKVAEQQ